jgi:diphthine-ammonia ligase
MKEEIFVSQGSLVSAQTWQDKIASLKASVKEDLKDEVKAVNIVGSEVIKATLDRIDALPANSKFGFMFSGGVDSTFLAMIAKKSKRNFTCYTVGFKDDDTKQPEDLDAALSAAKLIEVDLKYYVFDTDEAEELIERTAKMLGPELANVVNVGVGAVVVACIDLAKKDGVQYLFSGLGSEEIFAGYERHKKSSDIQEECWNGLFNMRQRDLLRDFAIAKVTGMNFCTPLMDEQVIKDSMRVHVNLKIDGEVSKLLIRKIAEKEGLPKEIAWRKKRAAQYGSRLDSAIDKIARQKGFSFKKDYLASLVK